MSASDGGPRSRNRRLTGSDPRSADPQSAQSFVICAHEASRCHLKIFLEGLAREVRERSRPLRGW
eukprot:7284229-Alexandrium_andersonii.AAC.1